MHVTIFKNFVQVVEDLPLSAVLEQIRDGRYSDMVRQLRTLVMQGQDEEYKKQKKKLSAFTVSGTFSNGRDQDKLVTHSGCYVLDLDHLSEDELSLAFQKICNDPHTYSCFRSPGNQGLKIIIRADGTPQNHTATFEELRQYVEKLLGIPVDPSGKDVTRLCFFSHDPHIYINEHAQFFKTNTAMIEQEIQSVIRQIESGRTDITNGYHNWLNIGFALADALGETGRQYFHRISSINSSYDPKACDKQFDNCLKSRNSGITIKTLFHYAKENGIDISEIRSCTPDNSEILSGLLQDSKKKKSKKDRNLWNEIEAFLQQHYTLRYNTVLSRLEIRKMKDEQFKPMTDYMEGCILRYLNRNHKTVSITKLRNILNSDFAPLYDPFLDYFNNLPTWDGQTDHIQQLADTVKTNDPEFWTYCFKKWIVAVAAAAYNPNVVNHTAIIISGPQGIGKTTWLLNLCPPDLKDYMFSGTINPNNKDTFMQLSECLLINMDELENMNKTEIGTLKEVITKSTIRLRRSYGHYNENLIRRASFMGSVNSGLFLNDPTGSRRFLAFEALEIDFNHTVDINMVYAQALALYREGFRFFFEKEDIARINENNERFNIRTLEEELLLTFFQPVESDKCSYYMTASEILAHISLHTRLPLTNTTNITIGKMLKKHKFHQKKKNGKFIWLVTKLDVSQIERNTRTLDDDLLTDEFTSQQNNNFSFDDDPAF